MRARRSLPSPPTDREPRPVGGRSSSARLLATVVMAVVFAAGFPGLGSGPAETGAAPAQPLPIPGKRYFAETGHNLAEPFMTRWLAAGGEAVLGPPQSEERYAAGAGGVLQTFTGLTLVYDPTQVAPWDVQGQTLERETLAAQAAETPTALTPVAGCGAAVVGDGCRYFAETGHTLSGAFAAFWATSGEQPIFGLPVSEPFTPEATGDEESGGDVQLFERAVLETDAAGGVRLRPLGLELAAEAGGLDDPAFAPAPPSGGTTFLVGASDGLRVREGPSIEAAMEVLLADNAEFIAASPWDGDWVPGYADGYAGWVAAEYLMEAPPLPQISLADWDPTIWQGAALGETNVRSEPSTGARVVEELDYGDPVTVEDWVEGEEIYEGADLWAKLGPGRYVYGRNVGRNAPVVPLPPPPDAPTFGKWIDVNLTQQVMTAYDGRSPVRIVEVTTGMAGWETPPGFYQILNRVANETMTSGAIGAEHFYKLEDVLFTQYFTDRGHAIHFAWWRTQETIGRPGSHGCVNVLLDDARFFWDWATIGTPVYVHP